jgi:hypothetical protein
VCTLSYSLIATFWLALKKSLPDESETPKKHSRTPHYRILIIYGQDLDFTLVCLTGGRNKNRKHVYVGYARSMLRPRKIFMKLQVK